MHDIIGDIHGHADELVELLHKLGYSEESGVFRHPDRRVLFCGDFIDRGPRIRDTINIVRSMCESGSAAAVMGNHELNALAYHTPHPTKPDEFLRSVSNTTRKQHSGNSGSQLDAADLEAALNWFRTLPVALDFGEPESRPCVLG
ncbi:MAG: metallophosphoesterase [Planctomycetaceae bacterium]